MQAKHILLILVISIVGAMAIIHKKKGSDSDDKPKATDTPEAQKTPSETIITPKNEWT